MADYKLEDDTGKDSTIFIEDVVGTLFISVEYADDGSAIADIYSISASNYNTVGNTVDLTMETVSPNNPFDGVIIPSVPADGVTEFQTGGLKFTVSDVDTLATNAQATLTVGLLTRFGTIPGGVNSDPIPIFVRNISTGVLMENQLWIVNKPYFINTIGTPLIGVHATQLINPISASYVVTFVGFVGGSNEVCQVSEDGGPAVEKSIVADGVTENTNVINGCEIIFNPSTIPGWEATIDISDATDFVKIAKDVSGVPDVNWQLGPIDLTQIDGIVTGRINDDELARFWTKYEIPVAASSDKNMRQFSVVIAGQAI